MDIFVTLLVRFTRIDIVEINQLIWIQTQRKQQNNKTKLILLFCHKEITTFGRSATVHEHAHHTLHTEIHFLVFVLDYL